MRPKKYFGQHFLVASQYARQIAEAVPADPASAVVEIGPGKGALSELLVRRFPRLHLIERDPDILDKLRSTLGKGQWTLHCGDALDVDFLVAGSPVHVVGNLPYGVAALLIHKTLNLGESLATCTFMVQKEVALRIAASPHSKQFGYLSVFCQFFGAPKILFDVPPDAFYPPPSVDSAVFQIIAGPSHTCLLPASGRKAFFSFVSHAFQKRRKTLPNALDRDGTRDAWTQALPAIGIDPRFRPEDLDVGQWLAVFALGKKEGIA